MPHRPRYLLELEAPPGDPPDVIRLRRLLKRLLRCYGLVCVEVRELPAGAAAGEAGPDADAPATPRA